jgi:hypothetical protein
MKRESASRPRASDAGVFRSNAIYVQVILEEESSKKTQEHIFDILGLKWRDFEGEIIQVPFFPLEHKELTLWIWNPKTGEEFIRYYDLSPRPRIILVFDNKSLKVLFDNPDAWNLKSTNIIAMGFQPDFSVPINNLTLWPAEFNKSDFLERIVSILNPPLAEPQPQEEPQPLEESQPTRAQIFSRTGNGDDNHRTSRKCRECAIL